MEWFTYAMNGRLKTLPCVAAALLIAVVSCVSPRDHCEEYRSLNSMRDMCFYELGNLADCREQLALGAVSEEDCERKERIMIYSCLRYATDSGRCSKEIDLPIVPKIVRIPAIAPVPFSLAYYLHVGHNRKGSIGVF